MAPREQRWGDGMETGGHRERSTEGRGLDGEPERSE